MRLLRILAIVVVLAGIGAGGAFFFLRPLTVTTVAAARGEAAEIVYATGVVEPRTWAKVAALVRERIVELCNCEGRAIEKGDVMARLDDREARAALAELRARQRLAKDELDRQIALVARNVASQQALDRARSEAGQVEAAIAGQVAKLENFVLRAPMQGIVLRQDGEVGEIAETGTVLFWVGQPRPLLVVADINEEDIPRIAVGQKALLRADAFPDRPLQATVDSITPKGDPVTKTYRVRFALPADTPLLIGMTIEVNAIIRTVPDALLVPAEAVSGGAVFVIDDGGVARRVPVGIGIKGVRQVQVVSGLSEGARVIAPVPEGLADGRRVRPQAR